MQKRKLALSLILLIAILLGGCNLPALQPYAVPSPTEPPTATFVPPTATLTPLPTPTKPAVCQEQQGSIESGEVVDERIDKPMRFLVYLPPCYHFPGNQARKYPVLYLLHGQNNNEEQWVRIGVVQAADEMINNKALPPFIMVFPFDYYSVKQPNQYSFEAVFIEKLVPTIEKDFRVLPGRANHAVGGLSRGGAWALHLGIRNPKVFGSIGGHSPVIFFADHKNLPQALLKLSPEELPRLWLDIGNSDPELTLMKQFEQLLTNNEIPHTWNVFPGYHEEKYWSVHVKEYLAWYANQWPGR